METIAIAILLIVRVGPPYVPCNDPVGHPVACVDAGEDLFDLPNRRALYTIFCFAKPNEPPPWDSVSGLATR